jgi:hypothetical protein
MSCAKICRMPTVALALITILAHRQQTFVLTRRGEMRKIVIVTNARASGRAFCVSDR